MGDRGSLSSWYSDIGIPINFQEESDIVNFWSIELHTPLNVSKDVRSPVQMRWRPRAFSMVSTGDSDIPSSCEMKDERAFNPLHANLAFFWVRASRDPIQLRQKTQGPSHIPIAEEKLLLRCLWKVGSPLQSKTGNRLSSWDDMGCLELSSSCCTEINFHIDLTRLSQEISLVSYRK